MRIRLFQLNPTVGDLKGNTNMMIKYINQAKADDIDLILFPELCVLGYPPMDLVERQSFIDRVQEMNESIIQHAKSIIVGFGSITKNDRKPGRPLYNSFILAQNQKVIGLTHKALLPTYDVFDEFRYFEPEVEWELVEINGLKLGLTICEDLWYNNNDYHSYNVSPAQEVKKNGANWILNISASPFSKYKPNERENMLKKHCEDENLPILYVNQVGANTELIFDGDSMVLNADGSVVERAELFKECFIDTEWDKNKNCFKPITHSKPVEKAKEQRIFEALVLGIRDYFEKSKLSKKAIVGLSGGIDSALTAVIAAEAIGAENVTGVTMPSHFSSEGSVSDSVHLAEKLGLQCHEIAIAPITDAIEHQLKPLFEHTSFGVAEENIQSRSRGILLMAISNKFGNILLNTGNKSEMAVGYCTLYGDMAGGLSVLSDVYKVEVFEIARWLNNEYFEEEVIPWNTINKPPSAELRPDQKDTDSLPEYSVLDGILKAYLEDKMSVDGIKKLGYNQQIVDRVIRLTDFNEYKRRQAPPGLRVTNKAFGIGRRIPIVQRWTHDQLNME